MEIGKANQDIVAKTMLISVGEPLTMRSFMWGVATSLAETTAQILLVQKTLGLV